MPPEGSHIPENSRDSYRESNFEELNIILNENNCVLYCCYSGVNRSYNASIESRKKGFSVAFRIGSSGLMIREIDTYLNEMRKDPEKYTQIPNCIVVFYYGGDQLGLLGKILKEYDLSNDLPQILAIECHDNEIMDRLNELSRYE